MRVPSGSIDRQLYFVAVDATDLKTRETGLASFTVVRSRNGAADATYTTPTIAEIDAVTMPGVYALLIDEDTTLDAGKDEQEVCVHITHAGMAPVTRTFELYRSKLTEGETVTASSSKISGVILADTTTTLTNLPAITAGWLTATGIAADAFTAAKIAADVSAEIADAVWDEILSGHVVAGSAGEALAAAGTAGDPWTTALPGAYGAGTAGFIVGTNLNATISSRMATYTQPTGFLAATFPGTVASPTNITGGVITTVTNLTNLPAITANWLTAAGLAADAVTEIQTGLATAANLATVDGIVNAILLDTGTDGVVVAAASKNGYTLTSGGIEAIIEAAFTFDAVATYATANAGSLVKQIADNAGSGSAPTVAQIADGVWDEILAGHVGAGSTGEALGAAGAAGDPWITALPGAYGAGSAGKIIGDNLNAAVSSRSSHAAADIWTVVARTLTAGTNIVLAKGTGVTGFNDLSLVDIRTSVGLGAANLDNQLALLTTGVVVASFTVNAKTELQVEANDALIANGLHDIATTAEMVDAVYDELTAGHEVADTFGALLTLIRNLETAEIYVETTTTPFQMVWIKAGTGTLTTGTRLLVRKLYKADGTGITADTMAIGRGIA